MSASQTAQEKLLPKCPARLSRQQLDEFAERGFLVFREVLTAAEVKKAKRALCEIIESRAPRIAAHSLTRKTADGRSYWNYYDDYFNYRGTQFGDATEVIYNPGLRIQGEPADDSESVKHEGAQLRIRKIENYKDAHPFLYYLIHTHKRIQGVMESLLCDAPQPYSSMALLKPPKGGVEKPWHQDNAYFNVKPLDAVVGLWIALDLANVANGCMHVLPGMHRAGAFKHYHWRDCQIASGVLPEEEAVPVELAPGEGIFFSPMLPHMTPPNISTTERFAIQLHFRGSKSVLISKKEFDQLFVASDGSPASCFPADGKNELPAEGLSSTGKTETETRANEEQ
ncbi:MAG: phytanoyl-CoA dioxygenase family protein [Pyrinomonadaceae bacterium]